MYIEDKNLKTPIMLIILLRRPINILLFKESLKLN